MTLLDTAHLVAVSLWGGVVLAEAVIELSPRDDAALAEAARLHATIDVLIELPLLVIVLATGGLLAARAWPPAPLLVAKLAAGLVAVGLNLYCVVHVLLRKARAHDVVLLRRHSSRVRLSAIGVPFGLAAAYLGITYFRW